MKQFRGPGGLEMFRLMAGSAVAEVAPSRGGIITRFAVGKDEILYLDEKTLADRKEKVRGGVPVLFPIAGRLTGDRYLIDGLGYPMRQHGLARHAAWEVINVAQAHLTMELRSSPATMVTFPFEFSCRLTVDVGRAGYRSLAIEMTVENRSKHQMPLHCGLHPYFLLADQDKQQAMVQVSAAQALDNTTGQAFAWAGTVDLAAPEVDLHLHDVTERQATLQIPGKASRQFAWTELFSSIVLWTVAMKDFVCVEPWSGPADAFNTGVGLQLLAPGESRSGEFVISI